MLPVIDPLLPRFHYIILHPPLEVVLRRGADRTEQPVTEKSIRKMHEEFSKARSGFEAHYVEAPPANPEDLITPERIHER